MRNILKILPSDVKWRGQRLTVKRGNGDKARLYAEVGAPYHLPEQLPHWRDPYNDLMRLWGFPVLADIRPSATHVPPAEAV